MLQHSINLGKGRALKTDFNYIIDEYPENDGVITVDADGQHRLDDIIKIAEQLMPHSRKLILGCRSFSKKNPLRSKLGNYITKVLFNFLINKKISDTQTGLRGIS